MPTCRRSQSSGTISTLKCSRRDGELARLDAEDRVLALVPDDLAGRQVPVPRAHAAGREREAAPLLAFAAGAVVEASSSAVRSTTRCFELGIEPLELPGLAIELGEDADLGAQHLRHDRHRHIVDRAHLVAAQLIDVGQMDRRDEDHRDLLEARMLADHRGELEAVELRHADVHQDDRDLVLEQMLQRLLAGRGLDQVLAQLAQDHLIGQQLRGLVVDQQDVDLVVLAIMRRFASSGAATCAAPTAAARC